jgi:pyocin large subunit-like protein
VSLDALTWALAQPIGNSSTKFVLVVLANCASISDWEAYPSVAYLSSATSQDRKTVQAGLRRLREGGLIEDTGKRAGATKQVIVYRLKRAVLPPIKEDEKRDTSKTGTVPVSEGNRPVFPTKEAHISLETGPKTDHGTVINHQEAGEAPTTGGGFEPTQDKPLAVLLDEARANMTPAGIAAVALRRVGVAVNSTNPDLVAALNDGVTAFELVDLAETHPGKPIRYLTQIARRQKAEGAAPVPIGRGPPPRTLSKTAEAFLTLEGMKSENRLAARRDFEGPAEAAGLIAGPDAGE